MSTTYTPGATVCYPHDFPGHHMAVYGCGEAVHYGIVLCTSPDLFDGEIVTVDLDCGAREDIPAGKLRLVEDD